MEFLPISILCFAIMATEICMGHKLVGNKNCLRLVKRLEEQNIQLQQQFRNQEEINRNILRKIKDQDQQLAELKQNNNGLRDKLSQFQSQSQQTEEVILRRMLKLKRTQTSLITRDEQLETKIMENGAKINRTKERAVFAVLNPVNTDFGLFIDNSNRTLNYTEELVNVNNVINLTTGIFTAPCDAVYLFNIGSVSLDDDEGVFCLQLDGILLPLTCGTDTAAYTFTIPLILNARQAVSVVVTDIFDEMDDDDLFISSTLFSGIQITPCH